MDSRYSVHENARAAALRYIPGGRSVIVPDNDFGDGGWVAANLKPGKLAPPPRPGIPLEAISQASILATRSVGPNSIVPTFDGVQGATKLNQWVMSKRKTFLPPEQFSVFQPYPDPPVVWKTMIGAPTRFDDR